MKRLLIASISALILSAGAAWAQLQVAPPGNSTAIEQIGGNGMAQIYGDAAGGSQAANSATPGNYALVHPHHFSGGVPYTPAGGAAALFQPASDAAPGSFRTAPIGTGQNSSVPQNSTGAGTAAGLGFAGQHHTGHRR
jgi:hypothetical protein